RDVIVEVYDELVADVLSPAHLRGRRLHVEPGRDRRDVERAPRDVHVDAPTDTGDRSGLAPLPERPAVAAPGTRGHAGLIDAPVRDPELLVPGVRDRGRVTGPKRPPDRARVDDRADTEPVAHLPEPSEDPSGQLLMRQPAGRLEIQDRHEVPRPQPRGVDEVVRLADRVV